MDDDTSDQVCNLYEVDNGEHILQLDIYDYIDMFGGILPTSYRYVTVQGTVFYEIEGACFSNEEFEELCAQHTSTSTHSEASI